MSERTFLALFFLCCAAGGFVGVALAFWVSS